MFKLVLPLAAESHSVDSLGIPSHEKNEAASELEQNPLLLLAHQLHIILRLICQW